MRVFAVGAVALASSLAGDPVVARGTAAPAPCAERVMQVVAHEDDDLLFMNPDIATDIAAGHCVRTVYLTAGDAGRPRSYWATREAGERAAYARMARVADEWTTATAAPGGEAAAQALTRNPNVSLVFLRLPDGGPGGGGFARYGHASIEKLWDGTIPAIATVDDARPVTYTKAGLVATLSRLMTDFRPGTIRVQDAYGLHDDHSDHLAAARLATAAQATYAAPHTLVHYLDYATEHRRANVTGSALADKKAAFYAYAVHDPNVCDSDAACADGGPRYAAWLRRQYAVDPAFGPLRAGDGRCADLAGGSRVPGTRVGLGACGSEASRAFGYVRATGEVRALGGTCLDGGDGGDGAVTVQPCTGAPSQAWRLTAAGELRLGTGCLTAYGARVTLATCGVAGARQWDWSVPAIRG